MSSMNRVLNFFKRDYKSINLDGIFGLRVEQGEYWSATNLKAEIWLLNQTLLLSLVVINCWKSA